MTKPKLKPCPGCGKKDALRCSYTTGFELTKRIVCIRCRWSGPSGGNCTEAEKVWNTRAGEEG